VRAGDFESGLLGQERQRAEAGAANTREEDMHALILHLPTFIYQPFAFVWQIEFTYRYFLASRPAANRSTVSSKSNPASTRLQPARSGDHRGDTKSNL